MPAGRPTAYDSKFCDKLISFMGKGYSLTAFAGSISVCRDTLNEWARQHDEFSDAVKVGKAKRTMRLEQTLLAGQTGPKVTAHIFALKNADPEGWRDKQEVEHSGGVKVTRIELVAPDLPPLSGLAPEIEAFVPDPVE